MSARGAATGVIGGIRLRRDSGAVGTLDFSISVAFH
jgi:hypothetical protein